MSWLSFFCGSGATLALVYAYDYHKKQQAKSRAEQKDEIIRHSSLPRDLAKARNMACYSSDFLTDLVAQMWTQINHAIGGLLKTIVQDILDDLPGSLRFTKFDLGNTPISLRNIVVHDIVDGKIKMDLDVVWNGNSDIDLTAKGGIQLGIQEIKFFGRLSLLFFPLIDKLPIVSAIQYSFINPPLLDFDFTGAVDLVDMTGLHEKILKVIRNIVNGLVVLPNRMNIILEPSTDLLTLYQRPLGIARVTVVSGRGFKAQKGIISSDIPDCYCKVKFGIAEKWKTSVIKNSFSPKWNEQHDYLVNDRDQIVHIEVYDRDSTPMGSDDFIGRKRVTIGELLDANGVKELALNGKDGNPNDCYVSLSCDLFKLTPKQDSFTSPANIGTNLLCGNLAILITQAFDVPEKYWKLGTSIHVKVGATTFQTGVVAAVEGEEVDTTNPLFNVIFHLPFSRKMFDNFKDGEGIVFYLMNGGKQVGKTSVTCQSVIDRSSNILIEKRLIGSEGTNFEFRVAILGMENKAEETQVQRALSRVGDEGVLQFNLVSGRGFKVLKSKLRKDIPDVYCTLKLNTNERNSWRSSTIKNNLTPVWNESVKFPISNDNLDTAVLNVEVWDENRGTDTYLGYVNIKVEDILKKPGKNTEFELFCKKKNTRTGYFITMNCLELTLSFRVQAEKEPPKVEDVSSKSDAASKKKYETAESEAVPKKDDTAKVTDQAAETTPVTETATPVKVDNVQTGSLPQDKPTDSSDSGIEDEKSYEIVKRAEIEKLRSKPPPKLDPDTIRLTAVSGRGFKEVKKYFKTDIPDIYCVFSVGSLPVWKTKVQKNTVTPQWNESHDFIGVAETDPFVLQAYDANRKGKDDFVGEWKGTVGELLSKSKGDQMEAKLTGGDKDTFITLKCLKMS